MATGQRRDHHGAFHFHVEIDGLSVGAFRHVTGLKSETEIFEYVEGGDNESVRKLVGQTRPSNLTLKRGIVAAEGELWRWRREFAAGDGPLKRRSGSIVLRDDSGAETTRWNFHKAWPVRWELSDLDSNASDVVVESLELAVERLDKK